jgi:queuine/archaeosine tRNA-ribosyltransferase
MADASPSPVSSHMKMNTPASSSGQLGSYVQLQGQIRDALREQHPEWIEKNGDCPTCESYESRFAELLNIFQSHERESAA